MKYEKIRVLEQMSVHKLACKFHLYKSKTIKIGLTVHHIYLCSMKGCFCEQKDLSALWKPHSCLSLTVGSHGAGQVSSFWLGQSL